MQSKFNIVTSGVISSQNFFLARLWVLQSNMKCVASLDEQCLHNLKFSEILGHNVEFISNSFNSYVMVCKSQFRKGFSSCI